MVFFFFNDTATTEIYTLSLHDALPIYGIGSHVRTVQVGDRVLFNPEDQFEFEVRGQTYLVVRERDLQAVASERTEHGTGDRKSTRLNSSHANISYAVFCLKKTKR